MLQLKRIRRVFVLRHGDYNGENRLSEFGRRQMISIAHLLMSLDLHENTTILTSSAPRATDSAEVLQEVLRLKFQAHGVLWSDNQHPHNMDAAVQLIVDQDENCVDLILVTHLEYSAFLVDHLREKLGVQDTRKKVFGKTEKGEGWLYHVATDTVEHLNPR